MGTMGTAKSPIRCSCITDCRLAFAGPGCEIKSGNAKWDSLLNTLLHNLFTEIHGEDLSQPSVDFNQFQSLEEGELL